MLGAGVYTPRPDYFPRLREICDRHNVLLIFDEIITGFGRTGKLFAAERMGAWPDILSCGKGLSGGYAPLSAIIIADKVAAPFWGDADQGIQFGAGHTYGGNPIACAVGHAVVSYMIERDAIGNADRVGAHLKGRLKEIATRYPVISEIRGVGMMLGIAYNQPIGHQVHLAARKRGLLIRPARDFTAVAPPLVTTAEEADEIAGILEASIADATA
jgi:adenosylmethionine-8-amino-7-oxononanoate aminotransferase